MRVRPIVSAPLESPWALRAKMYEDLGVYVNQVKMPPAANSGWASKIREILKDDLRQAQPPIPYHFLDDDQSTSNAPLEAQWITLSPPWDSPPAFPSSSYTDFKGTKRYSNSRLPLDPSLKCILYFHGGAYVMGSSKWASYKEMGAQMLLTIKRALQTNPKALTHGGSSSLSLERRVSLSANDHSSSSSSSAPLTNAHLPPLAMLSVEYRLAPDNPFPSAVEDGVAAYDYLVRSLGMNPSNIVIAGDSAGGNLAAAVTLALGRVAAPAPAGLVLFSPWLDLTLTSPSVTSNAEVDPILPAHAAHLASEAYVGTVATNQGLQNAFLSQITPSFTPPPSSSSSPSPSPASSSSSSSSSSTVAPTPSAQFLVNPATKALIQSIELKGATSLTQEQNNAFYDATVKAKNNLHRFLHHSLVSPVYAAPEQLRRLPPTMTIVGGSEILLDDSIRFFGAAAAAANEEPAWWELLEQSMDTTHSASSFPSSQEAVTKVEIAEGVTDNVTDNVTDANVKATETDEPREKQTTKSSILPSLSKLGPWHAVPGTTTSSSSTTTPSASSGRVTRTVVNLLEAPYVITKLPPVMNSNSNASSTLPAGTASSASPSLSSSSSSSSSATTIIPIPTPTSPNPAMYSPPSMAGGPTDNPGISSTSTSGSGSGSAGDGNVTRFASEALSAISSSLNTIVTSVPGLNPPPSSASSTIVPVSVPPRNEASAEVSQSPSSSVCSSYTPASTETGRAINAAVTGTYEAVRAVNDAWAQVYRDPWGAVSKYTWSLIQAATHQTNQNSSSSSSAGSTLIDANRTLSPVVHITKQRNEKIPKHTLEVWPGLFHVFPLVSMLPESVAAMNNVANFLRDECKWGVHNKDERER